ncbi:tetratricopeptide repeat protein [Vibrio cionasavignyae]|uniref:tetratricopeptide repeat protein n=1 Tax=Vibrio cionasavignyae TaxID=2910252 RepID=UPI003D14ADFE
MSTLSIAIGATSLSLILAFVWMFSLSNRKKRLEQERIAREAAYRRTIEKARQQERKERIFKAETGHTPTMLFLAKEAERKNIQEALYWYQKAAQLDNITGMYGMVRLSESKREDMVLREQANYWRLCIAGAEGDLHAKFEAAKALVYGRGVECNIPKGIAVIEEVAQEGNLEAMLFMGDWSVSPDNPLPSPKQSTQWFVQGAEKQNTEAMTKLGLNYLKGVGVEQSTERGCYWLERAAEKGSVEAMFFAGEAWRDIAPNGAAIAYIWLFMSAHLGYEPAKAVRDSVGSTLGVDSVVGLQSLAKPVLKKLQLSSMVKHSLIKALNKLYKRQLPLFELEDKLGEERENLDNPAFSSCNESQMSTKHNQTPMADDDISARDLSNMTSAVGHESSSESIEPSFSSSYSNYHQTFGK